MAIHQKKGIMGRQWVIVRTSWFQTENWPVQAPLVRVVSLSKWKEETGKEKVQDESRREGKAGWNLVLDCFL